MNIRLRKIAVFILVISMIVSFCGCGREVPDIYEGFELGMTVEEAVLTCKENLK